MLILFDIDAGEAVTPREGIVSDGSDTVADCYAGKAGTAAESRASYGSDSVADCYDGEAVTIVESLFSDGSDRVRDVVVIRAFTTRISNDCLYILIKQYSID